MAGSYPDIPAPRLAYDRDGSVAFYVNASSIVSTLSLAETQALQDEGQATTYTVGYNGGVTQHVGVMFPQLMDISGVHLLAYPTVGSPASPQLRYSTDTTNGFDGTWNNSVTIALGTSGTAVTPAYRNSISALSLTGVKAVRFAIPTSAIGNPSIVLRTMHFYGQPSAASDRLEFWHPTLDQPLSQTPAHFDWGDRPRSTTVNKQVRVKNLSATLTAGSITVGMEALTDSSPTFVGQHTFSYNGGAYGATCSISSLAPNTISEIVDVEQALTGTASLSLWAQRIYANAGTWS
jgi:hypothetical protein